MLTQDSNFDVQPPLSSSSILDAQSPTTVVQPSIGTFRSVTFSSVVSYVAPVNVVTPPPPPSFSITDLGSVATEVSHAAQVSASSASISEVFEVSLAAQVSASISTTDLGSISEVSSSELGSTGISQSACADGTSLCTYRDLRIASALVARDYNDPISRI